MKYLSDNAIYYHIFAGISNLINNKKIPQI